MKILEKLGIKKRVEVSEKVPEKASKARTEQTEGQKEERTKKPIAQRADQILVRPVLSEKGTSLASEGKYVFAVYPQANKSEIRKSIESIYEVQVKKVQIINLPGKRRRYGRSIGRTQAWKKAIVTVRKGEKIPGIIEAVG